ncbi:Glutamine synthetase [Pyrobaculum oguniense TE7]|uniref:Glutamine synthetase n=1 Tax=Pyrobaculum oguniense (strain DSM 13380 / JCM 10595 / TE7) TaxID=698757 RepID=H6Q8P7_PYROT|nr:Glutamine synthetase [Pyrobaculum oguniense TE7]
MPEGLNVWRVLKGAGVKYVKFVIVDIFGRPKVEITPIDVARDAFVDGVAYDGSSIPAYSTVNKSDLVAAVDPHAVYVETWNGGKSALVFTNTLDGDKPHPMDPRNALKQTVEYVRSRGYEVKLGAEVEFFLVRGNPPSLVDNGAYFEGYPLKDSMPVIEEIIDHLYLSGIGHSKTHHEVAPSQYEVNIPAGDPVQVADQVLVFKILAKSVAQKYGVTATFMPKPFWGMNGSGMHVHVSFWRDGVNLFSSYKEPTPELKAAVAGVLENALSNSVFVAPTVNSYKRLVPHHEAPTRVVWGIGNRSVMVRIPYYGMRINRLEYRHPDPSANPYLGFAAIILAALEGVERKLEPPRPVHDVAYELEGVKETPRHLGEAVKLASEGAATRALPQPLVKAYLSLKEKEWADYLNSVGEGWEKSWNKITSWEYQRYLDVA